MKSANMELTVLMRGIAGLFRVAGKFNVSVKKHQQEKNFTAQCR